MRRSGNGPPAHPACPDGAVHGPHVVMIDVTRDATHASCAPESSANPPGPRHGCGLGSEKLETPTCTDRPARCTSSGAPSSPAQEVAPTVPAPIIHGATHVGSSGSGG